MILLITIENDEHADLVESHLQKRGASYFRLNTDALYREYKITFGLSSGNLFGSIEDIHGRVIFTQDIKSVWYRRTRCNPPESVARDSNLLEYSLEEYTGFFRNLWRALIHAVWMDDPVVVHFLQDHRLSQYQKALEVGFEVPDTFYTNNGVVVIKELDSRQQIAIKPIARAYIRTSTSEEGTAGLPLKGILTRVIRPGDFSEEQLIVSSRNTPVQFQGYIDKDLEIRLTVVGDRLFPCEIHSQKSERTRHDWRRYDFSKVEHRPCDLPSEIEEKIKKFMKLVGLNFGAIDLIRTLDGRYVFLEVNPAGQWQWIQAITNMPIAEEIGNWLIKHQCPR